MVYKDKEKRKRYGREQSRKYYKLHKDKVLKYHKKYYAENREKIIKKSRLWAYENRGRNLRNSKMYRMRYRKKIQNLLGNKCIVCGENDWRILEIDHVNNDGYKERKEIGCSYTAYRRIYNDIKVGSKRYQLLCSNCNMRKKMERMGFKYKDIEKDMKEVELSYEKRINIS